MTDEERQRQLVKDLRDEASCWSVPQASVILCGKAADEIERLTALAQPDAEPVAWRWRYSPNSDFSITTNRRVAKSQISEGYILEPLYTAQPCPDVSAGLLPLHRQEREMTDEERQERLCSYLRKTGGREECLAADEIERLVQELSHREIDIETQRNEIDRLAGENEELKKTQLKFRTEKRQPFIIRDEP